jgi:hypothetical protein
MIESMACGTPVIAYRHGSVPEVIDEGVTGFVVDNEQAAVRAVERVAGLNRAECRRTFERRFSVGRMTDDYLAAYRGLIERAAKMSDGTARIRARRDSEPSTRQGHAVDKSDAAAVGVVRISGNGAAHRPSQHAARLSSREPPATPR